MILKILSSFLLATLLTLSPFSTAIAQTKEPIGLLADAVDYHANTGILVASGNVRVISGDQVLSAKKVVYNQKTGELSIPNGFKIMKKDGTVLQGTDATLTSDLEANLIKGARFLIADQFQLAADQAQHKNDRFKVLDRVVASTCHICKDNPIPLWQIRSNRVIHDELEKQLYFEHARLEVLGLPVLYAPNLRLPDPTVDRATGFLIPTFFTSDILKFGTKIPYFIEIGDHSDLTVTAYMATVGSLVAETQYRRETKNGSYQFDSSLLLIDGVDHNAFRSSLWGSGRFKLRNNFEWGFSLDVASDKTFRAQYDYEDEDALTAQDRLISEVFLERNSKNSYFGLQAASIQSLRTNEIDAQIPVILPDVYWRRIQDDPLFDGKLGLTAHTTTLWRPGGSNFTRIGLATDWQREWETRNGILFGAKALLEAEHYFVDQYSGTTGTGAAFNSSSASRITPTLSADIRWPLSRSIGKTIHIIEPIVQLVWSDDTLKDIPNEDSVQVEFEETNLFSLNRFPGFDQKEQGLRANVGINYTRYDPTGWNLGVTVGRIYRNKDLSQFSTATGLAGKHSDWVSAISLEFPSEFRITNRILFDSGFDISKNETSLAFSYKKLQGEATYIWLEKDVVAGASDRRREAALELTYTPNDNWTYLAEWRHDFIADSPTEGEFGIKYQNECVEVNLSLSLQYAASGNVSPTKRLGLTVALLGIGKKANAKRRKHHCSY